MNAETNPVEQERRLRSALEAVAATQDPVGDWGNAVVRSTEMNASLAAPELNPRSVHSSRRALTVAVVAVVVLVGAIGIIALRPGTGADALAKVSTEEGVQADRVQACLRDAGVALDISKDHDDYGNPRVTFTAQDHTDATRAIFERCSRPQPRSSGLPASVEVDLYTHTVKATVACLAKKGFDVTTRGEPADGPVSFDVPASQKGEAFNEAMGACVAQAGVAEKARRKELLDKHGR